MQLVYTMFIGNNHDLFHLWWHAHFVKHQNVWKYYDQDFSLDENIGIMKVLMRRRKEREKGKQQENILPTATNQIFRPIYTLTYALLIKTFIPISKRCRVQMVPFALSTPMTLWLLAYSKSQWKYLRQTDLVNNLIFVKNWVL